MILYPGYLWGFVVRRFLQGRFANRPCVGAIVSLAALRLFDILDILFNMFSSPSLRVPSHPSPFAPAERQNLYENPG